jgi:hypothetical protein
MARNDVVLLDSLLSKARARFASNLDESEVLELFSFEQVLKDFDLSYEELESGWTDGPDDGAIDGFFVLVDGQLATEDVLEHVMRRNPEIHVFLFSVRHADSFQQQPLNALRMSVSELFDLTKSTDNLAYPFAESVLTQREMFRKALVNLADRRPKLVISIHFCSRGDSANLADNLTSRAQQLCESVHALFSEVDEHLEFDGTTELLELARREKVYSLHLKFIESYISREGRNYVVLATLPEYFRFMTDEAGQLRRYLFESNVRDYLGEVRVNDDIMATLDRETPASEEDFSWLNNGVTILATHATVVGKELSLENVQIVNGLQTTETIYRHFHNSAPRNDERAILLKIILASDDFTRARIIKATNYQNGVDLASLRGLDKIQRDIEHYLFDHGWFYDRRRNFYKNEGKPAERIVSLTYLGAAVRAIALGDPARSQNQRSKSMRDDGVYAQLFNSKWDLSVYLASLEITRAVETALHQKRTVFNTLPIALVHHIGFVYVCTVLGKRGYAPNEVAQIAGSPPTEAQVFQIRSELREAATRMGAKGILYMLRKDLFDQFVRERFR